MKEREPGAVGQDKTRGSRDVAVGVHRADMDRVPIERVPFQLVRIVLDAKELPLDAVDLVAQPIALLQEQRIVVEQPGFELHGQRAYRSSVFLGNDSPMRRKTTVSYCTARLRPIITGEPRASNSETRREWRFAITDTRCAGRFEAKPRTAVHFAEGRAFAQGES